MALQHLRIQVARETGKEYVFTAWINPFSYSYTYGIQADSSPTSTGNYGEPVPKGRSPGKISFKLILDATGLVAPPLPGQLIPSDGVASLINDFIKNCAGPYEPGSNQSNPKACPPILNLSWAQLQFKCILSGLSVDYKLFKPDGTPIRAELSPSFIEYGATAAQQTPAIAVEPPPPMPKLVTVTAGDTLPMLCTRVYGDASLYMLVAMANQLTNFRSLTPGAVLVFPPLMSSS